MCILGADGTGQEQKIVKKKPKLVKKDDRGTFILNVTTSVSHSVAKKSGFFFFLRVILFCVQASYVPANQKYDWAMN